jgi:choline dehydrogenase
VTDEFDFVIVGAGSAGCVLANRLSAESGNRVCVLEAARHWGNTTFHVMGTCRMGPTSDASAVVDDALRVRGVESLRVIDASVMPSMISANLNAATMMIADKASDLVLGKPALEPARVPE